MFKHVRSTMFAGIIAFLPLFVVIAVAAQAFAALNQVIAPVIDSLGLESRLGAALVFVLSILALLGVIYLLGLIARFGLVSAGLDKVERNIANKVPIYGFIKSIVTGAIDETETAGYATVEVAGPHGTRIGFITDRLSDGRVVVFLPDVPNPRTGQAVILTEDACTPIDVPAHKVFEMLTSFGRGMNEERTG